VTSPTPGTAFGLVEMLDGVFSVIGNIGFGYLYDVTGNYQLSIACLFALSIIGVVMILFTFMIADDSEKGLRDEGGSRYSMEDLDSCEAGKDHTGSPRKILSLYHPPGGSEVKGGEDLEDSYRGTWKQQANGENQHLLATTANTTTQKWGAYQSLNQSSSPLH
jgi:hypothetical protein